jgi:hypothetical protein
VTDVADATPKYPMLKFVVRHGPIASPLLAAVVFCIAIAIAVTVGDLGTGMVVLVVIIGGVFAALAYVLSRVIVELVGLITDMLLPQA